MMYKDDKKYRFGYDDPYKILASVIVGYDSPCDVVRCLYDNSYLLNRIIKETRAQDFSGHFTDCIIEDILENKDRMEYMARLDVLSGYYYSKLDKERLRKEIALLLDEAGINITELENCYSTAGNVSEAKA